MLMWKFGFHRVFFLHIENQSAAGNVIQLNKKNKPYCNSALWASTKGSPMLNKSRFSVEMYVQCQWQDLPKELGPSLWGAPNPGTVTLWGAPNPGTVTFQEVVLKMKELEQEGCASDCMQTQGFSYSGIRLIKLMQWTVAIINIIYCILWGIFFILLPIAALR